MSGAFPKLSHRPDPLCGPFTNHLTGLYSEEMDPAPRTGRRSQGERRAETQEALLAATIDCLIDLGYARTTTREVARRAGVSRGAQTHHYPTKDDLVVAAVEHLFEVEGRRFVARFRALPPRRRTADEGIALLWEIVSGPTYPAVLEVVVAGRTDPSLQVVVHGVSTKLEATVVGLLQRLFPDVGDRDRLARTLADLVFALVQGAAVASYGGYGDPDRTIAVIRSLARLVRPESIETLREVVDAIDH